MSGDTPSGRPGVGAPGGRRPVPERRSRAWRVGAYLRLVEDPSIRPRRASRAWWRRLALVAVVAVGSGVVVDVLRHLA